MKAQMQQKMDQLKKTDPELAAKMSKVGEKMEAAMKNGTDPKAAMQSIKSEVGELSDKELSELKSLGLGGRQGGPMQGPPSFGGGAHSGRSTGGSSDIESTLLKALTDSDDDSDDSSKKKSSNSSSSAQNSASFQKLISSLTKQFGSSNLSSFGSLA